jgi:hypothetical protein
MRFANCTLRAVTFIAFSRDQQGMTKRKHSNKKSAIRCPACGSAETVLAGYTSEDRGDDGRALKWDPYRCRSCDMLFEHEVRRPRPPVPESAMAVRACRIEGEGDVIPYAALVNGKVKMKFMKCRRSSEVLLEAARAASNRNRRYEKANQLKLTIDLVPGALWYMNLRKQLRRSAWDKLRKPVYARAGFRCQICGVKDDKLHCHEIWRYKDNLVRLAGFRAVCAMCHFVEHLGLAETFAFNGHLDLRDLIKHFMKVNRVSREVFEIHRAQAFDLWRLRSGYTWHIDYGRWAKLIGLSKGRKGGKVRGTTGVSA